MIDQSLDPRTADLLSTLADAASAAGSALALPGPLQVGEPAASAADILGVPASLAASLKINGKISGELVLLTVPELDPALDDRDMGGLTALSPRARALKAAAEALGCRSGEVVEGDPTQSYGDLAVTLESDGVPVAALLVREPVTPAPTPDLEHDVEEALMTAVTGAAEVGAVASAPPASPQRLTEPVEAPGPGFRSSVPTQVSAGTGPVATRLDQLTHVEMEVTVEIGRTRLTVGELLGLAPGQVVELDRTAGAPVDLYVNGTLLARGEVVVVDEDFGFRVTEIVSSREG
jgi:flagellar motor switch protein FliN/FliY